MCLPSCITGFYSEGLEKLKTGYYYKFATRTPPLPKNTTAQSYRQSIPYLPSKSQSITHSQNHHGHRSEEALRAIDGKGFSHIANGKATGSRDDQPPGMQEFFGGNMSA